MYPLLFQAGEFIVPSYLAIVSLSFCVGIIWFSKRAQARVLDRNFSLDLALAFMFGGLLGARLFHVVFERPDLYLEEPLRVLYVWQGGFVFYGGAIGAALFSFLMIRFRSRTSFWVWADTLAPVLAFGYALGRLGCFLGGCCFGRGCDWPWAVRFPEGVEAPPHVPLHPTQLYAVGWELTVLFVLLKLEKRTEQPAGKLFLCWVLLHALGRIVMEYFRGDFRGTEPLGLSISTLISLALIALSLFGLMRMRGNRNATRTY